MKNSNTNWEELYQGWLFHIENNRHSDAQKIEGKVRSLLNNRKLKDVQWLIDAIQCYDSLSIPSNRVTLILKALKAGNQMPNMLFEPMIKAGVYEINPSYNRLFIEPSLRCFGVRKVISRLMEYFTVGSNHEKAGSASAFYWALGLNGRHGIEYEDVHDLVSTLDTLLLEEFVYNSDIEVRRRIIPQLIVDKRSYPKHLHSVVSKAISIVMGHLKMYRAWAVENVPPLLY